MVPSGAVGALIGKGGGTIDAMQKESSARIRIPSDKPGEGGGGVGYTGGGDERLVLITGSEEQIEAAQALIEGKLQEHAERDANMGGKHVKAAMKKRERAASKPIVEYEDRPVFDKATGQLKIERVKVERSREEEEDAAIAALHGHEEAPSSKRVKPMKRYGGKGTEEEGERTHFFRDDAKEQSLNDLVAAERRGGSEGGHMDHNLAGSIARSKRFKGISADDEYDHDIGVEMSDAKSSRQSDAKRHAQAKGAAASEQRRNFTAAEKAEARFSKHRHLILAIGNHVYLRVQDASPLGPAHCVIEPVGANAPSLAGAAEEVADEVRNFQKCYIRMLEASEQAAVFLEQHMAPMNMSTLGPGASAGMIGGSMRIECVPLTARDGKAATGFFRKAILESGEEWSQHRKLYETKGTVRGSIPPGFSYFCVGFGIHAGYATVIENQDEWPADFGRDVLEGILEHEDSGIPLARRGKEPFERLQARVLAVGKKFEPFDWTKQM